ncbi:MAG: hypothetical protein HY652_02225 [Acidobacteria bacterium]|nr:hypothetical protein [Acidobacteriota bacterium]
MSWLRFFNGKGDTGGKGPAESAEEALRWISLPNNIDHKLRELERRGWSLWVLVLGMLLLFALYIVVLYFNSDWWRRTAAGESVYTVRVLLVGFATLVLLFCAYVVSRELQLRFLKRAMIQEEITIRQQLMRSEKLASLGQLTAGVAHEILNPLNVISGRVQMLSMRAPHEPELGKALDIISEQTRRIVKITDGLRRFSHTAAEKKPLDVNDLLEKTLALLENDLRVRNIQVVRRFQPRLAAVMADADQLTQVFVNLILNAKDAMPRGGTLTLSTALDGLRGSGSRRKEVVGNRILIAVTDTGCGIPAGDLEKIFHPFFTTKEPGKGTGLGLFVCHGIIENHNGAMEVLSREGEGTTFRISLPAV